MAGTHPQDPRGAADPHDPRRSARGAFHGPGYPPAVKSPAARPAFQSVGQAPNRDFAGTERDRVRALFPRDRHDRHRARRFALHVPGVGVDRRSRGRFRLARLGAGRGDRHHAGLRRHLRRRRDGRRLRPGRSGGERGDPLHRAAQLPGRTGRGPQPVDQRGGQLPARLRKAARRRPGSRRRGRRRGDACRGAARHRGRRRPVSGDLRASSGHDGRAGDARRLELPARQVPDLAGPERPGAGQLPDGDRGGAQIPGARLRRVDMVTFSLEAEEKVSVPLSGRRRERARASAKAAAASGP